METLTLKATIRQALGNQVGALRRQDKVPAVVYGPGVGNRNLSLDYRELEKVYHQAGESTLIDLVVDDTEPVKVIVQDLERDPIKSRIIHVDLLQVNMNEEMTASIALRFIGEASAVKIAGALLIYNIDNIEVSCLPKDLVSHIDIDLSKLVAIDDSISVGDIALPAGMKILTDKNVVIVVASAPLSESEYEAAVADKSKEATAPVESTVIGSDKEKKAE